MEKQTDTNLVQDPEPERYYDWMLWKLRQENTLERSRMTTMSREDMWKKTVADKQSEIHALQKTVEQILLFLGCHFLKGHNSASWSRRGTRIVGYYSNKRPVLPEIPKLCRTPGQ